jgi:hypothetical protein
VKAFVLIGLVAFHVTHFFREAAARIAEAKGVLPDYIARAGR